jgi:hypothetical protein
MQLDSSSEYRMHLNLALLPLIWYTPVEGQEFATQKWACFGIEDGCMRRALRMLQELFAKTSPFCPFFRI